MAPAILPAPPFHQVPVATFSIVAYDPETKDLGVAVESKFFAVGSVVPWAKAGVGAIATQAFGNTTYGPKGLELLASGKTPAEVIEALTSADEGRDRRQVGIVDAEGNAATYTGKGCNPWAGGKTGTHYSAQGNILVSEQVVAAMGEAFEKAKGELADRLLAALEAGQSAGGDSRGQQSAALFVVRDSGGYAGFNDRYIDLRVDDNSEPIKELGRLLKIQHAMSRLNEASALYGQGKYKEAVEAARKAVEYRPDYGDAHYDLACFLSLAGDADNSLKELEIALRLSPKLGSLARTDSDLNNVRSDPRYEKILSELAAERPAEKK
ncbi:MAG: DUF1028 domain-containing protein [Candidatus Eisenbacteria bacterium]|nr:DUF1028 domain-containing protein [Candidatus Eisenbacteria bacterium]